jgi:hypothetical protein
MMTVKQMQVADYMRKYVILGVSPLFWKRLRRQDDGATFDTFYDIDVLHSQRDYAEEEARQRQTTT